MSDGDQQRRGGRGRKPRPAGAEGFDNRKYWETRYTTEPERGSGVGSRGVHLEYKRDLLNQLIDEVRPRSILDVGCGDIEVVKDLAFSGAYTGIDLSPTIVERNRSLRPDWNFVEGDFLEWARDGRKPADLVVCFDVLIHQHDAATYRNFVRALVDATEKVAVMNGFRQKTDVLETQDICAFHEPLRHTLSNLGVGEVRRLGRFRRTTIFRIDKEGPASTVGDAVGPIHQGA